MSLRGSIAASLVCHVSFVALAHVAGVREPETVEIEPLDVSEVEATIEPEESTDVAGGSDGGGDDGGDGGESGQREEVLAALADEEWPSGRESSEPESAVEETRTTQQTTTEPADRAVSEEPSNDTAESSAETTESSSQSESTPTPTRPEPSEEAEQSPSPRSRDRPTSSDDTPSDDSPSSSSPTGDPGGSTNGSPGGQGSEGTGEGDGGDGEGAGTGDGGTGEGAGRGPGNEEGSVDIEAVRRRYLVEVSKLVNREKMYPRLAQRSNVEGTVQLEVEIDARGDILAIEIAKSSGRRVLDRAAIRTVRRLGSFPEPPEVLGWRRKSLRIPIEFGLS